MPINLRDGLTAIVGADNEAEPSEWLERLAGVMQLITDPKSVITAISTAPVRHIAAR